MLEGGGGLKRNRHGQDGFGGDVSPVLKGGGGLKLLMLGYEPSKVRSRHFLADYSRGEFDLGITPQ